MNKDIFEAQTVVALVDPKTGALIFNPPRNAETITNLHDRIVAKLDTGFLNRFRPPQNRLPIEKEAENVPLPSHNSDETRILSDGAAPGQADSVLPEKISSDVPDDETVLWKDAHAPLSGTLYRRAIGWVTDGRNRRLLLWSVPVLIMLASVVYRILTADGIPFEPMQSAAAEVLPKTDTTAPLLSGEQTASTSEASNTGAEGETIFGPSETPVGGEDASSVKNSGRLKDAVDALTEGRIDEAVGRYLRLSEQFPKDPSMGLVLRILETAEEQKQ